MTHSKKSVFKSALDFDGRQMAVCLAMIAEQNKLLAIVKTALPIEIAKSVNHCVRSKHRLLLYTESASWASQLRFYHQAILNKLAETEYKNPHDSRTGKRSRTGCVKSGFIASKQYIRKAVKSERLITALR
jgi:hypothetical protein